jgi:hypothetical protein
LQWQSPLLQAIFKIPHVLAGKNGLGKANTASIAMNKYILNHTETNIKQTKRRSMDLFMPMLLTQHARGNSKVNPQWNLTQNRLAWKPSSNDLS